jgi:hypothetical protein
MTMLTNSFRNFSYTVRRPSFGVAATVLALGIGATSAIFSLVSAVWLKPLPCADVERIVSQSVGHTPAGFWLSRLDGDPAAVGCTISLYGSPHLIVGDVPRDFHFAEAKKTGVPAGRLVDRERE